MGRMKCPRCDEAGVIFVKRQQRNSNGTTTTVEVEERCPRCKGMGWIEGGQRS